MKVIHKRKEIVQTYESTRYVCDECNLGDMTSAMVCLCNRHLCGSCFEEYEPSPEVNKILDGNGTYALDDSGINRLLGACPRCFHKYNIQEQLEPVAIALAKAYKKAYLLQQKIKKDIAKDAQPEQITIT